jgi:Cu-processing system ATP-binding protein
MSAAIQASGLTKHFGAMQVLRGLDLELPVGRITGLVGPNAAGKSTLIKSILGLVHPDGGTLSVLGTPVGRDETYRRQIGYMPQAASFPENLTGREVLDLVRDLRGPGAEQDLSLLASFGLEPELDKRVRTLSGGTRQKLSAALAFLFCPRLLILDEPTAGLDPVASGVLKEKLDEARSRGVTVLLASHTLSELEEVADDIVFLHEGRVRFQGPIDRLRRLTGFARLEKAVATLMQGPAA